MRKETSQDDIYTIKLNSLIEGLNKMKYAINYSIDEEIVDLKNMLNNKEYSIEALIAFIEYETILKPSKNSKLIFKDNSMKYIEMKLIVDVIKKYDKYVYMFGVTNDQILGEHYLNDSLKSNPKLYDMLKVCTNYEELGKRVRNDQNGYYINNAYVIKLN